MTLDTQRHWAPLRGESKWWINWRERETEGCEYKEGRTGNSRVVMNSLMWVVGDATWEDVGILVCDATLVCSIRDLLPPKARWMTLVWVGDMLMAKCWVSQSWGQEHWRACSTHLPYIGVDKGEIHSDPLLPYHLWQDGELAKWLWKQKSYPWLSFATALGEKILYLAWITQ